MQEWLLKARPDVAVRAECAANPALHRDARRESSDRRKGGKEFSKTQVQSAHESSSRLGEGKEFYFAALLGTREAKLQIEKSVFNIRGAREVRIILCCYVRHLMQ